MSAPAEWGDPEVVPKLVADHILTTGNAYAKAQGFPQITIDATYLRSAIVEVTPQTQIIGAALLQVTVADPTWKILRSGLCNKTPDGLLYQVDVNFPEGTPVWWRLADVQFGSVDSAQGTANLTLTFQHRIVSYLSDCWGPVGWPPGKAGQTRAQFVKMLVEKMPKELPKQSIGPGPPPDDFSFVCPDINVVQPIAGTSSSGTTVIAKSSVDNAKGVAKINKQPAITAGTKLTIRGGPMSAAQKATANAVLAGCAEAGADVFVTTAAILVGMNERTFNGLGGSQGPFWDPMGTMSDSGVGFPASPYNNSGTWTAADATQEAKDWCTGGGPWKGGWGGKPSAMALAHSSVTRNGHNCLTPIGLAQVVQGNSGPYEAHYPAAAQTAEATAIINAYNGGNFPASSGGGSSANSPPKSDVSQLTRGQPNNPDEDTWACLQRLASDVNWSVFSSPSPAPGVFGNYIYYIDQPTLVAQKPALYLELSADGTVWKATDPDTGKVVAHEGVVNTLTGEIDNTSMQRQVTRTVKGKIQRKRLLNSPQTPAQLMFNMICGALEYNAGDVFVFHEAGPADGRWIVEDVTQNTLGDLYAQFTLGPPTYPYPEPAATTTASSSKSNSAGTTVAQRTAQGAADIALQALAREQKSHCFVYQQRRPIDYPILTGSPVYIDCSGFVIACYKLAGLPDPSANNYDGAGYTGDMITHCTPVGIGSAQPGDMVFYGPYTATEHVTIYVGNGQVVSMGQMGDPDKGPWQQMGPSAPTNNTLWRSKFLTGKEITPPTNTGSSRPSPHQTVAGPASGVATGSGGVVTKVTGIFKGLF